MKFSLLISFVVVLMINGCAIEEQIDKAANKCEEKVATALESFEDVCLTKEEILELIRSLQENEDAQSPHDAPSTDQ